MTDDELRKLAEAALADDTKATPGPWMVEKDWTFEVVATGDQPGLVGKQVLSGDAALIAAARTREPELARAVLRLLTTVKVMRGAHVSDATLDSLRTRYDAVQEEVEAHDKRWGGAFSDALSDLDQVRAERDELARHKAAVEAMIAEWSICPDVQVRDAAHDVHAAIATRLEQP
jgi:hypothetical protein